MVLGICGLVFGLCYGIGVILSLVGLPLGIVAYRDLKTSGKRGNGMAVTGLVTNIIVLSLATIVMVFLLIGLALGSQ